jgi:type IV pilus assembly protein PilM
MLTFKKPSFLGIDFGMSHIKAVELTLKDDRPHLIDYGEALVDFSDIQNDTGQSQTPEEKMQTLLVDLLHKMAPKSESAYIAMPGSSGLITLIELPKMSRAELEHAVRFEAQRYIPSPLSEVVLSWDIVSNPLTPAAHAMESSNSNKTPENVEILLVAALHKEVEKYENYIASSTLKMEMLELETFSLARSLVGDNEKTVLIVDIGSRSTNLILVDSGYIKINRNLNVGGHDITTTLAESLNVTWERADMIKAGDKDFLNNKEAAFLLPALELIINESRRMMTAYQDKKSGNHVDHIILSGGASKMRGLDTYLSKTIALPVVMGAPWKSVNYDSQLEGVIARMGTSYSVAIGLALAGIESYERS